MEKLAIWTLIAVSTHMLLSIIQIILILFMLVTGVLALKKPKDTKWSKRFGLINSLDDSKKSLFAVVRLVSGLLMLIPVVTGAPFWISAIGMVAALFVLLQTEIMIRSQDKKPSFLRKLVTVFAGILLILSFVEINDPLSAYSNFIATTMKWRPIETGELNKNDLNAPKVGDMAIDFTLYSPDGNDTFTLSNHYAKKPVLITFGSYT